MERRLVCAVALLAALGIGCGDEGGSAEMTEAPTMQMTPPPLQQEVADPQPMMAEPPPPPMPVPCGAAMCQQPSSPLGALGAMFGGAAGGLLPMAMACCLDAAAGSCGLAMEAGGACEPPAVPDARCPSVDLGPAAAFAAGLGAACCTTENMCGIDGAVFGRGCVENGEATTMLSASPIGGFLMLPPPRGCDDAPDVVDVLMQDEDAGI